MSSSTIVIKRPLNYRQSLAVITSKVKEYSPALLYLLWGLSGIYAAGRTKLNQNVTGITLSFEVLDLTVLFLSSMMLQKGVVNNSMVLVLPWIFLSMYTMYDHHYMGLVNTLRILKPIKKLSWLPWSTLIGSIVVLIIRATLTVRTFQLCIHLWFQKKLKEMKKQ